MIAEYFIKVKYIFFEEGFLNLLIRLFRFFAYKAKRIFTNSNVDRKKWEILKQSFTNTERVFLLGNGPSLNNTPLHLLSGENVLCTNRFNLFFERLGWTPNMFCISDDVVLSDMINELNDLSNKVDFLFLPAIHPSSPVNINYKKQIKNVRNVYWFYPDEISFSSNLPFIGINKTVTNVAIQILIYLGFKEIYLAGMDFNFFKHKNADYSDNRHIVSKDDNDPNHFDPRYFGKNRTYHIPRLEETLEKFKDAKLFAEENGVRIFNATIGGELEVFERANFSNLFNVNPNKELRLSLSSILTDFEVEKISGDTFSDVFPSATVYNTIEDFNFEEETSIIKNTLGTKIVSKLIKEYTVIGPVNNEFFVKRRT